MVSGFLTSPWDHARMSSAVARPIRNSSKKLTSSTGDTSLSVGISGDRVRDAVLGRTSRGRIGLEGRTWTEWDSREVSPTPPQVAFRGAAPGRDRASRSRGPSSRAVGSPLVDQVVDRGGLVPGQVDAQVRGRPLEVVVVAVAHLDGHTVAGEHLDVQAE